MSKFHLVITGAATAALLAASVIPSALGSSGPAHRTVDSKIGVTFDVLTFLNGQSTTYHPFVDDPGSQCWYDSQNNRNWMQMPGLNVEGPGPRDTSGGSAFGAVGTFDLGLTGSGGDFTDFLNAQLDQRASEPIFYLPEIQWPDGTWHFPQNSDGYYQWMLAYSHAGPSAGSADDSWMFLRGGQWGYPQYDGGPGGSDVAAGYGANWEWDSMYMDGGPGVYHVGGFVEFEPWRGFPGEDVVFHSNYGIDSASCGTFKNHRALSKHVATRTISAPTQAALTAKILNKGKGSIRRTIAIHMFSFRHSRARPGHLLKASTFASTSLRHPKTHIVKRGKVICKAKIGKTVGHRNHHPLLKVRHKARLHRLHHRKGAEACLWRVPRHTKGKKLSYAVILKVRHHARQVYFDIHKVKR